MRDGDDDAAGLWGAHPCVRAKETLTRPRRDRPARRPHAQGILLKLRFTRSGHKFVFPIQLSPVFDVGVLAAAAAMPPLLLLALTRGLEPIFSLHEQWKARKAYESNAEVIRRSKKEAEAARKLLHNVVQRKRRAESEKGGLIIIEARYGSFEGAEAAENDGFPRARPEDLIVDVTSAVQFLVDDSKLELHKVRAETPRAVSYRRRAVLTVPSSIRIAGRYQVRALRVLRSVSRREEAAANSVRTRRDAAYHRGRRHGGARAPRAVTLMLMYVC